MINDERTDDVKPKPHNGYGVSVAMLLWSVAFLLFPKWMPSFPLWIANVFYVLGFVALLMGTLGLCIEVFKVRK